MKLHLPSVLIGLGLALVLGGLATLGLTAGLNWLTGGVVHSEVEQTLPSPDGRHVAYLLIRDAGATTAPTRQVAVTEVDEPLPTAGNLFRARNPGAVSMTWENERELVIHSEAGVRFFDAFANGIWATLVLEP